MPIASLVNVRDVGGLPVAAGGRIHPGVLLRSAALDTLTDEGLADLSASPVGVIADLRTDLERSMAPDRIPSERPFEVVTLPLLEGALPQPAVGADGTVAPASFAAVLDQLPTLGELYVSMLRHGAPIFAQIARLVAASRDDEPTAVLVHCTAGKDRTGVAVAVLLDAAGADRAAIVADYASSQGNLAGPWATRMVSMVESMGITVTEGLRILITGTPPAAIEQALAWIDAEHGGSAAYLSSGGLEPATMDALRERLVG